MLKFRTPPLCFMSFCVTFMWPTIHHSGLFYAEWDTDGSQGLDAFAVALQHSVLLTAGFKLPIMQRSLIHEVYQVSNPCHHIHPSQWPVAMLTWNNGLCRLMLISPRHIWQLNREAEIYGYHPPLFPSLSVLVAWIQSPYLRKYFLYHC